MCLAWSIMRISGVFFFMWHVAFSGERNGNGACACMRCKMLRPVHIIHRADIPAEVPIYKHQAPPPGAHPRRRIPGTGVSPYPQLI